MFLKTDKFIPGARLLFLLLLPLGATIADQRDFDSRQEQQPRSHDFDVKHYRIELSLDESTRSFDGKTSITLAATIDGLDVVTLDAETFTVHEVSHDSQSLRFTQEAGDLNIELADALPTGTEVTLDVQYSVTDIEIDSAKFGMGDGYDLGFNFKSATESNPAIIFSLNFPEGARHWFPSFDHPSDWATHETVVHVRSDYRVLANGALVSDTINTETGRRTVHWSQSKPQPTYLYVMVAGSHSVLADNYGELPLHYWVYPGDEADGRLSYADTPRMVGFFEEAYGTKYPWVKYDQIIIPGIGGGAESTSATVIAEWTVMNEAELAEESPNALIAHELAHQWWGDMVGYRYWEHMWLSESFATHAEYLWALHDLDADGAAWTLYEQKAAYLREAESRFIRPIVTNKWNRPNEMFDRHTYEKGGIVLNMFRELVGEEMFSDIMQSFLETHAYKNATTDDFLNTVADISGADYGWFFEQWLFQAGHPVLDVSYDWNADKQSLAMTIKQEQDRSLGTPIYRMPVRIGFTTKSSTTTEIIWLDREEQSFTFSMPERPLLVKFDDGDVLLKEWRFAKTTDELVYQLQHDDMPGRLWAVSELKKRTNEPSAKDALSRASQSDRFWAIRESAAGTTTD